MDEIPVEINKVPEIDNTKRYTISSKNIVFFVILGVVLFLTVIGIIYFSVIKKSNPAQPAVVSTEKQSDIYKEKNESSESTNEITDWQTYTNTDYKFSMQYPSNWNYQDTWDHCKNDGSCRGTIGENELMYLVFTSNDNTQSFHLLVSKDIPSSTISDENTEEVGNVAKHQLPDISIDGVTSKKYKFVGPGSSLISITTKNNNLVYEFSMNEIYWDTVQNNAQNEIYDKILNSFNFL